MQILNILVTFLVVMLFWMPENFKAIWQNTLITKVV